MRKYLFLCILSLLLAACGPKADSASESAPASAAAANDEAAEGADTESDAAEMESEATPGAWSESFSGTLDGKIELSMDLTGLDETVRGTLTYKSSGKPIMVLGSMSAEGTFFLREYQPDGLVSGVMSGSNKAGKMSGTWFSSGKERTLALKSTGPRSNSVKWAYDVSGPIAGEYGYHFAKVDGMDGASGGMSIKQKGDQVTFDFNCVNGPPAYNMALVDATTAALEGNKVTYKMPDIDCKFSITFYNGFAIVAHVDEMYECEFGNGAGIEGEYLKLR